jgi:hypothetical protein
MTSFRVAGLAKRIFIILGFVLSVVLLYLPNTKVQRAAANRLRADREVTFQAEVAQYRGALRTGVT